MNIIDKIKNLLNRTIENGCTEEEVKTSLAIARKLMIKHKLSETDVNKSFEKDIIKLELHYDCNVSWIFSLLKVFLDNFSIMYFMINRNNKLHCCLFGNDVDVKCVETLMSCAYNYVLEASEKYLQDYIEIFGVKDDSIKSSFRMGFIKGLSDKYIEQNKTLNSEEALMIIPDKKVKDEFEEYTKDFEQQELEFSESKNKNDADFLAVQAGYNEGRNFGTTALAGE